MDEKERLTYTEVAFKIDFAQIGEVLFMSAEDWKTKVLDREDVDPTGVHKPWGITAPQYVLDEIWTVIVCPEVLNRPLIAYTDNDLVEWIQYWLIHTGLHFVVLVNAELADENLTLEEIDIRVEAQMKKQTPDLYELGEKVKSSFIF